jgi:hypothetical protein
MTSGQLTFPLPAPEREEILAVRRGDTDFNACMTRIGELEHRLEDMKDATALPAEPNYAAVNQRLVELYQAWWAEKGFV